MNASAQQVKLGIKYCPGLEFELPNHIFHADPDPVEMAGVEQPGGGDGCGGEHH
jgi:hypothetical protein